VDKDGLEAGKGQRTKLAEIRRVSAIWSCDAIDRQPRYDREREY